MPSSCTVGTDGQFLERVEPKVASTRNWPALTSGAQPAASEIASIWPPNNALLDSETLLNGTAVHLIPRCLPINCITIYGLAAPPGEPYVIFPGLASASAMNSPKVCQGASCRTTRPEVRPEIPMM